MQRIETIGNHPQGDGLLLSSAYASVRWSGRLVSSFSGVHTFFVTSRSGIRLLLDGVLVLDRWLSSCNMTSATFTLQASSLHAIQLEAKILTDSSPISLQWSSVAFLRESIPSVQMFSCVHVAGSPFFLLVAPAVVCATKSTAVMRGTAVERHLFITFT
jgi:hypothetical protein